MHGSKAGTAALRTYAPVAPTAGPIPAKPLELPPIAPVVTPAEAPPAMPPAPPLKPPVAMEQRLPPPMTVGAQLDRHWSLVLVGLLVLAGMFFWLRPHGSAEPSAAVLQCRALTTKARIALSSGDAAAAESNIVQARGVCSAEQSKAVEEMERQLDTLRTQMAACAALEKRLAATLGNSHPRDVSDQLTRAPQGCADQPAIASLVERSVRQMEQATEAINAGFGRLNAGDFDGADALLASALHSDVQASGAEGLRNSLAKARAAVASDVGHSPPEAMPVVATPPPIVRTQRAPIQAPVQVDGVFDELLGDGRQALRRKNYAEAKSAAKSALRLSPRNRMAEALLRDAEDGEREALQSMDIH